MFIRYLLDRQMLQDVLKKLIERFYKKEVADRMVNVFYCHYRQDISFVEMRRNDIAQTLLRYGFDRIFVLFEWRHVWIITKGYLMYKASGLN